MSGPRKSEGVLVVVGLFLRRDQLLVATETMSNEDTRTSWTPRGRILHLEPPAPDKSKDRQHHPPGRRVKNVANPLFCLQPVRADFESFPFKYERHHRVFLLTLEKLPTDA